MTRRSSWSNTVAAIRDGRVAGAIAEVLEGVFGAPAPRPIPVRVASHGRIPRNPRRD